MMRGSPRRPGWSAAFSVLELLVVVTVMGIVAAMIIPFFLDAMQKARQRRTMAEMNTTGKAMMMWLTDQLGAAAAGASTTMDIGSYDPISVAGSLAPLLVPQYVQEIPTADAWGFALEYYLDREHKEAGQVAAIRSPGRDGTFEGTLYTVGIFDPTDYEQDLVWADGFFVRWPARESE